MNHGVVLGLGFGDEGKGSIVDLLCSQSDPLKTMVVRFSGGQQAGHTVYHNKDFSHVFSNFGSGTLRGYPTFWSHFCTVDPYGFKQEHQTLTEKGIKPVIYIDLNCPVTTLFDKMDNQRRDSYNGTCGTGFGSTLQREENHYHLKIRDLLYPSVLFEKFSLIAKYYKIGNAHFREILDNFLENVEFLKKNAEFVDQSFLRYKAQYGYRLIFEGSQGLLLDQNHGFFPHVTRSNTGMKNVLELIPDVDHDGYDIHLVTRTYLTRHGNGPINNFMVAVDNPYESNVTNKFQGEFRKRVINLDWLKYGYESERDLRFRYSHLIITHMDAFDLDIPYILNDESKTINKKAFPKLVAELLPRVMKVFTKHTPFPMITKYEPE